MAISDAQYQEWLRTPAQNRLVLCDFSCHDGTSFTTRYFSNGKYINGAIIYDDILLTLPFFSDSLPERMIGLAESSFGDLKIRNPNGVNDVFLNQNFFWAGYVAKIYFGDSSWAKADFRLILDGFIQGQPISTAKSEIQFRLMSKRFLAEKNINRNFFPASSTFVKPGTPMPICIGPSFNVSPVLINQPIVPGAYVRRYQVGSVSRGVSSAPFFTGISGVYDDGIALTYFGGAGNIPPGRWRPWEVAEVAPNTGFSGGFDLGSMPSGEVTCDAYYTNGAVINLDRPNNVLQHVILEYLGLGAYFGSVVNLSPAVAIGLFNRDGYLNGIEFCDKLAKSSGSYIQFRANGQLWIKEPPTSAATFAGVISLDSDDILADSFLLVRQQEPMIKSRHSFFKNWFVQSKIASGATGYRVPSLGVEFTEKEQTSGLSSSFYPYYRDPGPFEDSYLHGHDYNDDNSVNFGTQATTVLNNIRLREDTRNRYYSLTTFGIGLFLEIGDTVLVTHPRFGFSSGKKCIVFGSTKHLGAKPRAELLLWTDLP